MFWDCFMLAIVHITAIDHREVLMLENVDKRLCTLCTVHWDICRATWLAARCTSRHAPCLPKIVSAASQRSQPVASDHIMKQHRVKWFLYNDTLFFLICMNLQKMMQYKTMWNVFAIHPKKKVLNLLHWSKEAALSVKCANVKGKGLTCECSTCTLSKRSPRSAWHERKVQQTLPRVLNDTCHLNTK